MSLEGNIEKIRRDCQGEPREHAPLDTTGVQWDQSNKEKAKSAGTSTC